MGIRRANKVKEVLKTVCPDAPPLSFAVHLFTQKRRLCKTNKMALGFLMTNMSSTKLQNLKDEIQQYIETESSEGMNIVSFPDRASNLIILFDTSQRANYFLLKIQNPELFTIRLDLSKMIDRLKENKLWFAVAYSNMV